jgi:hypothetical protein
MYDDAERLLECPELRQLLNHYAQVSGGDREAWQDRLAELPGVSSKGLVQLHGELIAYDWLEQNTGVVVLRRPGVVAACYRITAAGRRVLRLTADSTKEAA